MWAVDLISNIPGPVFSYLGYWIIMLFALSEAIPFIGFFLPGGVIVMVGGFLSRQGEIHILYVILFAAIGSVLGDFMGYYLGKRYGYSLINHFGKYFFFKEKHLEKIKIMINKHLVKTQIISRFNSVTRTFAPFFTGASNISFGRLMRINVIGAIIWAIFFSTIGYIFGKSYEVASKYVGGFFIGAIGLSIIIIYTYRFINKKKHIFTRYNLIALILNIASLYMFSKMVEDVIDNEFVVRLDVWINTHMMTLWNPQLNNFMINVTNIVNPLNLTLLSIGLLIVLIFHKKRYHSMILLSSILLGLLFELMVKSRIHRVRPTNALINIQGHSFPSGHSTMAIIFFSLVIYSFKDDIKSIALRTIFIIINIILFTIIGFSRIYLNVHWFSDVIAGFSLGMFCLTLIILIFKVIIKLRKKASILFHQ